MRAGEPLVVDGAELVEVLADEAVEVGFQGLPRAVDADGLVEQANHGDSLLPDRRAFPARH